MQANQQRGEVNLAARDKVYVLALGVNAICAMETPGPHNPEGRSFNQVLIGVRAGRLSDARLFLWAALQMRHADEVKTLAAAGDLLDHSIGPFGMVKQVTELVDQLIDLNKPPAQEGAPAGEADPPVPATASGTGVVST
jgi:hypothetical protein